jgi:hypothetical protein
MTYANLIKELTSKIHWILLITLTVAVISIVYFYRTPFMYHSTASFFIDDDEAQGLQINETDQNNLFLAKVSNGNRLYHLAKSTEMADHLIKKFNLYDHYQIDPYGQMHYESINALLKSRVTIIPSQYNAINIVVKDYDKYLAANIANEIFYKLDAMNKEFIISNVEKKVKIYNQLLSNSKKQSLEQSEEMMKLIEKCNLLLLNKDVVKDRNILISDLKVSLSVLSSQLSTVNNDMLKAIKTYEIATSSLQEENLPNLRLIDLALPDLRTPLFYAISWTLLSSVIAAIAVICTIGIIYENGFQIEKLLNKPLFRNS